MLPNRFGKKSIPARPLEVKRGAPSSDSSHDDAISESYVVYRFLLSMRESRSNPDNMWTKLDNDRTVTIFARKGGGYGLCIADDETVTYSHHIYEDQEAAAAALLEVLDREGGCGCR
jgi:hypothetical protein